MTSKVEFHPIALEITDAHRGTAASTRAYSSKQCKCTAWIGGGQIFFIRGNDLTQFCRKGTGGVLPPCGRRLRRRFRSSCKGHANVLVIAGWNPLPQLCARP